MENKDYKIETLERNIRSYQGKLGEAEYKLRHRKGLIAKYTLLDKLESAKLFGKFILPYVLATGLTTFGFIGLSDVNPFSKTEKKYSTETTSINNKGIVSSERVYSKYNNYINRIYRYSAWTENENGSYSRTVETYNISDKNINKILDLINKENLVIEDIFNKPNSVNIETKLNLTEEELLTGEYYEGELHIIDKNDYITFEKKSSKQLKEILLYIIFLIITNSMAHFLSLVKWSTDCEYDGLHPTNGELFLDSLGPIEFPEYDIEYLKKCIQEYKDQIEKNKGKISQLKLELNK